jgi:hypothetical protein
VYVRMASRNRPSDAIRERRRFRIRLKSAVLAARVRTAYSRDRVLSMPFLTATLLPPFLDAYDMLALTRSNRLMLKQFYAIAVHKLCSSILYADPPHHGVVWCKCERCAFIPPIDTPHDGLVWCECERDLLQRAHHVPMSALIAPNHSCPPSSTTHLAVYKRLDYYDDLKVQLWQQSDYSDYYYPVVRVGYMCIPDVRRSKHEAADSLTVVKQLSAFQKLVDARRSCEQERCLSLFARRGLGITSVLIHREMPKLLPPPFTTTSSRIQHQFDLWKKRAWRTINANKHRNVDPTTTSAASLLSHLVIQQPRNGGGFNNNNRLIILPNDRERARQTKHFMIKKPILRSTNNQRAKSKSTFASHRRPSWHR